MQIPLLIGLVTLMSASMPALAAAKSCSQQYAICYRACMKAAASGEYCLPDVLCGRLRFTCLETGCWNGPQFKACGLRPR